MGIADRQYYRDDAGGRVRPPMGRLSVNTWLIIVNSAIFVSQAIGLVPKVTGPGVQEVFRVVNSIDAFSYFGHFSTAKAFFFRLGNVMYLNLEVWRLLTFQFLHADVWHLFFNMFGLYMFGGMVEQFLGRRRYLAFYLLCGICGGLMYLVLNLLGQTGLSIPGVLVNDPRTPLVGASAGVFGVILACAHLSPDTRLMLIFPPIPLPLRVFAYAYVAFAAFNLLIGGANAGGDAAHVGGAIAGAYFIRNSHLLRDFFAVFPADVPSSRGSGARARPRRPSARAPAAPSGEIDRILAKVATQGLASLSQKEKDVLRRETDRRRGEG